MSVITVPHSPRDLALDEVARFLLAVDPDGGRLAGVLRRTFDQLYDGQRTGRWKVDQLLKTEKTHFGTLVEINLQREYGLSDGAVLDFTIMSHEVDCKFSHTGAWMLPQESFDQLVLVIEADDASSIWNAGLVRVTEENRRAAENRDRKTGLSSHGKSAIRWLHRHADMAPNALLQLDPVETTRIMSIKSGQARLDELFRVATNRILTRNIVATVAQQSDYMKRVRENGGSRTTLRPEGILLLVGNSHTQREIATQLGAVVPSRGEVVSLRVLPGAHGQGAKIDGTWWRLAAPGETATVPAPVV